jgi:hypothetical protein
VRAEKAKKDVRKVRQIALNVLERKFQMPSRLESDESNGKPDGKKYFEIVVRNFQRAPLVLTRAN